MSSARAQRQQAIRQAVRAGAIRTQAELVEALAARGFEVTQATVSRDISELDLRKDARGVYALPETLRFNVLVDASVRETRRAGNQVVILTGPGAAMGVATALDSLECADVLGCIAGDDTVLAICADGEAGQRFQESIDALVDGAQG